jgi:hypothetical protein
MKFRRINLHNMRSEEWFNFLTEFKRFVEGMPALRLKIAKLFAVFLILYDKADKIIEKIRKSRMTPQIAELDKQRDTTFRGLVQTIESHKNHFDSAKRNAAESLQPVLKHYGNLAIKPYNEETAGINNFLQELRENHKNAIETLELTDWLNELERNNQIFEDAVLERNREEASKTDLHLLDVRRETNHCYKDIIERLEALILLEEDEQEKEIYISFVKLLNTNIKRYLDAAAKRKGRSDAKGDNDYDEED